jgi:predicted RNA polymerase sigma factor
LPEELPQDALVAALEQWPESGVPDNPASGINMYRSTYTVNMWP